MTSSDGEALDLLVHGGIIVTEDGHRYANIGIRGESIVSVSRGRPLADRVVDASGLLVLPGGIDAHTHFNSEWPFVDERRPADGFESGTRGAAAGGITTVCDFVYPLADERPIDALDRVIGHAASSYVDVALHMVMTRADDSAIRAVEPVIAAGCPSFKFYTPDSDFIANRAAYLRVLERIGSAGGIAMFHCEDAAIAEYSHARLVAAGHTAPRFYPESKPVEAELSATVQALSMATVAGVPSYIVHLSAGSVLDAAIAARAQGATVMIETRPLYLYLTAERFEADDATAARYIGTPPIRTGTDRARLWDGLATGEIDVVASDHVGFTAAQKYAPGDTIDTIPKGVASVETLLPMLYSEGVASGGLSLERFVQVIATNPARAFGIYPRKGTIAVGSDADICLFDPSARRLLRGADLHSAADLEVFEGTEVVGWPVLTISRGQIVYERGRITGHAGRGRFVGGRRDLLTN
jgi:dihydropyrimidinase